VVVPKRSREDDAAVYFGSVSAVKNVVEALYRLFHWVVEADRGMTYPAVNANPIVPLAVRGLLETVSPVGAESPTDVRPPPEPPEQVVEAMINPLELVARHPALTMPGMTRLPVEIAPVKVDVAVPVNAIVPVAAILPATESI
jgi:hypothetical protein